MKRIIPQIAALLTSGCLYVAPIDEEPPSDDVMPQIHEASPGLGVVDIDLSADVPQQFILSSYGDDNLEQAIYSRIVMDYRPAGVALNAIVATVPLVGEPGSRDRLVYEFRPCEMAKNVSGVFEAGKTMVLYFLIADERFIHENQSFLSTDFSLPFRTYNGRGAVWVQWTLLFRGKCLEKNWN